MLGTIISARHGCNGCGSRNNSLGMGCLGCPHSNLGRVRGVKGFGQTDDTGSGIPDTSTSFNSSTGTSILGAYLPTQSMDNPTLDNLLTGTPTYNPSSSNPSSSVNTNALTKFSCFNIFFSS
jgi:hypothetical protein